MSRHKLHGHLGDLSEGMAVATNAPIHHSDRIVSDQITPTTPYGYVIFFPSSPTQVGAVHVQTDSTGAALSQNVLYFNLSLPGNVSDFETTVTFISSRLSSISTTFVALAGTFNCALVSYYISEYLYPGKLVNYTLPVNLAPATNVLANEKLADGMASLLLGGENTRLYIRNVNGDSSAGGTYRFVGSKGDSDTTLAYEVFPSTTLFDIPAQDTITASQMIPTGQLPFFAIAGYTYNGTVTINSFQVPVTSVLLLKVYLIIRNYDLVGNQLRSVKLLIGQIVKLVVTPGNTQFPTTTLPFSFSQQFVDQPVFGCGFYVGLETDDDFPLTTATPYSAAFYINTVAHQTASDGVGSNNIIMTYQGVSTEVPISINVNQGGVCTYSDQITALVPPKDVSYNPDLNAALKVLDTGLNGYGLHELMLVDEVPGELDAYNYVLGFLINIHNERYSAALAPGFLATQQMQQLPRNLNDRGDQIVAGSAFFKKFANAIRKAAKDPKVKKIANGVYNMLGSTLHQNLKDLEKEGIFAPITLPGGMKINNPISGAALNGLPPSLQEKLRQQAPSAKQQLQMLLSEGLSAATGQGNLRDEFINQARRIRENRPTTVEVEPKMEDFEIPLNSCTFFPTVTIPDIREPGQIKAAALMVMAPSSLFPKNTLTQYTNLGERRLYGWKPLDETQSSKLLYRPKQDYAIALFVKVGKSGNLVVRKIAPVIDKSLTLALYVLDNYGPRAVSFTGDMDVSGKLIMPTEYSIAFAKKAVSHANGLAMVGNTPFADANVKNVPEMLPSLGRCAIDQGERAAKFLVYESDEERALLESWPERHSEHHPFVKLVSEVSRAMAILKEFYYYMEPDCRDIVNQKYLLDWDGCEDKELAQSFRDSPPLCGVSLVWRWWQHTTTKSLRNTLQLDHFRHILQPVPLTRAFTSEFDLLVIDGYPVIATLQEDGRMKVFYVASKVGKSFTTLFMNVKTFYPEYIYEVGIDEDVDDMDSDPDTASILEMFCGVSTSCARQKHLVGPFFALTDKQQLKLLKAINNRPSLGQQANVIKAAIFDVKKSDEAIARILAKYGLTIPEEPTEGKRISNPPTRGRGRGQTRVVNAVAPTAKPKRKSRQAGAVMCEATQTPTKEPTTKREPKVSKLDKSDEGFKLFNKYYTSNKPKADGDARKARAMLPTFPPNDVVACASDIVKLIDHPDQLAYYLAERYAAKQPPPNTLLAQPDDDDDEEVDEAVPGELDAAIAALNAIQ